MSDESENSQSGIPDDIYLAVRFILQCLQQKTPRGTDIPIASLMICASIIGSFLNIAGVCLIHRNSRITYTVKSFVMFSLINNVLYFVTGLYLATCIFSSSHCLSTEGYPWSGYLSNQIFSTLHFTSPYISIVLLHVVTIIRGSYVFSFQSLPPGFQRLSVVFCLFVGTLFLVPPIIMIAPAKEFGYEYSYLGAIFDTNFYFIDIATDWGKVYVMARIFDLFLLLAKYLSIVALIADIVCLRRYMNYQTFSYGNSKHADVRFSLQMIALHSMALVLLFEAFWMPIFYEVFGGLYPFITYEFLFNLYGIFFGCLVVFYNQKELSKRAELTNNNAGGIPIAVLSMYKSTPMVDFK